MKVPLHLLLLEDNPFDAELNVAELQKANFAPSWQLVETEADFRNSLDSTLDLILADFNLPQFDGLRALKILQEQNLDIPFILVSGTIGEEMAVAVMKQGATDYLLKDRLARLGPAVTHALEAKKIRAEKQRAEATLRENEKRFRALIENSSDVVVLVDPAGLLQYISPSITRVLGYAAVDLMSQNFFELIHPDDRQTVTGIVDRLLQEPTQNIATQFRFRHQDRARPDGAWHWLEAVCTNLLVESNVQTLVFNCRDITERRRTEEQVQRQLRHLKALRNIDIAISSSLDRDTTLHILLETIISELKVDAADVLLLDSSTQTLAAAAAQGFRSNGSVPLNYELGEDFASPTVWERRMVHIPDLIEIRHPSMRLGPLRAEQMRLYYGVPLITKGQVKGVLEVFHHTAMQPDEEWLNLLEAFANRAAIAIDNIELFTSLQRKNMELGLAYDSTLAGWSRALDLRDKETEGHSLRVTDWTVRLAQDMGFEGEELVHLQRGALLHDIGKMGISDQILLKPGPLTAEEWEIMRKHPVYASELLAPIDYLRPALPIPYCHHEKWDGSGYPRGLKGRNIPEAARIFAIVDVWDALRNDRPYRPAWPEEKALSYIQEQSERHFDREVVAIFLQLVSAAGQFAEHLR